MNIGTAAVPGTTIAKVSAVRRLRAMPVRPTYSPTQVEWVKEKLVTAKRWAEYNNSAPGARAGKAPALTRTMPDGRTRLVKFDGIQGDYVVDRKWSVSDRPHARAQMFRQSQALKEAKAIGLWEVPNQRVKTKALKIFRKHGITNIHVKVVKP